MSTSNTSDRLTELLTGPVAELGLDLEAVDVSSAGRRRVLRVAVDKDGGVGMEDIAEVTRWISRTLDESNAMGQQPYTLEVSSPGVDRPLTQPRHWRRNTGRLVRVRMADGDSLTGRVTAADDSAATLDVDGHEQRVEYSRLTQALVQVEFKPSEV